jgi:hypothetical protein
MNEVWIKTVHGRFQFRLQKYLTGKKRTNYLELTQQLSAGYISPRLQELCGYYSNRMSYEEVALLVERVSGSRLLSDQKISQIVRDQAMQLSQEMHKEAREILDKIDIELIEVNPKVDIYNPDLPEILLFDDGIQVKGQKSSRQPKAKQGEEPESKSAQKFHNQRVITDLVMLQKAEQKFEYITAPIERHGQDLLSLADMVKAQVIKEYGSGTAPLDLVAITDGAKVIRQRLVKVFGTGVVVILDWYHLCKKLRGLMSMIAINKVEKSQRLKFLLSHLWQGKTAISLEYLRNHVVVKNQDKWQELIDYLSKHQSEIIDYDRRSRAGKTIGSGQVEKGVDLTVGSRQKHRGMSWSPKGSKALCLLKVAELNGQWQQLWFPAQSA